MQVTNYRLSIVATLGKARSSLLVAQPDFDDAMVSILFAGDVDGDGIPDLLIETSRHYNMSRPVLYLSRPAAGSQLLQPVGGQTSVGC